MSTPQPSPRACLSCRAPADAYARFCVRCGQPVPAAAPAPLGPVAGGAGGASVAVVAVAIVAAVMVGMAILGILAAIAIPNFLRYQLRSKESGVRAELLMLHAAEKARVEEEGSYELFDGGVPAGSPAPGAERRAWSADEQRRAEELGWALDPARPGSYAVYTFAAREAEGGRPALAVCAETDLDGDGEHAAWSVLHPGLDADGEPVEPPPAPCGPAAVLAPGEAEPVREDGVTRLSPPGVF